WGPYEMYRPYDEKREEGEAYSILTSRHHEDILLQKAGHCDLVETRDGEWYAVHLCGRASDDRNPEGAERFAGARRYVLGRETAIQKMCWTEDGWPVLAEGGNTPRETVEPPACAAVFAGREGCIRENTAFIRDDFDGKVLHADYQSLRIPMDGHYLSLTVRPGWLRMYGRSGLASRFTQSLIARRMTEYHMYAETCLDFEPEVFKQMAGLILLYDTDNYLYLHISHDEDVGKCVTLLKAENRKYEYLMDYVPLLPGRDVILAVSVQGTDAQFFYGYQGKKLQKAGECVGVGFLSDEACREGWFTGTMIGICCQDLTGFGQHADFDWFEVNAETEKIEQVFHT
ncbi:MAG: family 43 glycosylhydrolase, partial [Lachnospiraceae bacterium]|nr:family 43 glycosylhydrolase [Lachnospiraceae bacterium]